MAPVYLLDRVMPELCLAVARPRLASAVTLLRILAAARSAQYVAPAALSQPGVTVDTVSDIEILKLLKKPAHRHNNIT